MDDPSEVSKDLFVRKTTPIKTTPLIFYLPVNCLDEVDIPVLRKLIGENGGAVYKSLQNADIILVDPARPVAVINTRPSQVVLNKEWVKLCIAAKALLDGETNWAKQLIFPRPEGSTSPKGERPALSISTGSADRPTLPGIHSMGLFRDGKPITHDDPSTHNPPSAYEETPALSRGTSDSPSNAFPARPMPRDPCTGGSSRTPYANPKYALIPEESTASTRQYEGYEYDPYWRGGSSSPLYRRYDYYQLHGGRHPQNHEDYARLPYARDNRAGFQYASTYREHDYRRDEAHRRIAPPGHTPRGEDPFRDDKHLSTVLQRTQEDLYHQTHRASNDRDREREPSLYDHYPKWWPGIVTLADYGHTPPPPPSYYSSSPEEHGPPGMAGEMGADLRVVQYDPKRYDPHEKPMQRVYRGGYPVSSKADSMKAPEYKMADGRIWTVDDNEPPPRPDSPPRKNGSKRHNQYSEAEDWFLVNYANWLMRKEPRIEMKDLYQKLHEQMRNHTALALYLRVNKSREYFRRLGMDERALSRRIQQPSARRREWDTDLPALTSLSMRDRA